MSNKRALILGVGGQDGSFLADILIEQGWEVHGLHRASSVDNLTRVRHLAGKVTLHRGDVTDRGSLSHAICEAEPDVIFNVADQDHVGWSFDVPEINVATTFGAVVNLLEAVRDVDPTIRVFQPCSVTMFGDNNLGTVHESTRPSPMSPYAVCKAAAFHAARCWRQVHGLHVSTAILSNHDSARRKEAYLVNGICRQVVRVKLGQQDRVRMGGDLTGARHKVGHARQFMEAAVKLMELSRPEDVVISNDPLSDPGLTIEKMVHVAFKAAGICGTLEQSDWTPPPGPICTWSADNARARQLLNFNPMTTERVIDRIVKEMLEEQP